MNFFQWTGNPFADTGIAAILAHARKKQPQEIDADDVQSLNALLMELYLTPEWLKAMQNIFPNGALTNGAFAKNRAEVWKNVVEFLTAELAPAQESGNCGCCGRHNALRLASNDKRKLPNNMVFSKVYVPLNGGVPNFFPGGAMGADLCANCVYAIQCAPLNFYTANCDEKRFMVVHSNSERTLRDYSREAAKAIDTQLATGQFSGPFNDGYKNAHNAFFHLVEMVLSSHDFSEDDKHTTITLYHFDNYNQPKAKPLQIYSMPARVFRFLAEVANSPHYGAWKFVVARNYYFLKDRQKIPLQLGEDDVGVEKRKFTRNLVFENLLADQSIISRFYSRRSRQTYAPWELLALYLKEIRSMQKERLETIKRVGDDLADLIQNINQHKKRLEALERASNYNSFRNVLRLCIKERINSQAAEPLFSFDEYVEQLFPEGNLGWRETQDLLLFRIYERLHPWLKAQGVATDDVDTDAEDAPATSDDPEAV